MSTRELLLCGASGRGERSSTFAINHDEQSGEAWILHEMSVPGC